MSRILVPVALGLVAATSLAQVPCHTAALGTNLGLVDETVSSAQTLGFTFVYDGVSYTQIQVCDNGYITLGPSGGQPDFSPSATTLVADPFARICPLWVDLDPGATGSGSVYFLAVPASGSTPAHAVISWDGVFDYFGSTPHTFQLTLIDGGTIRCNYDSTLVNIPTANPWLIGASPGNAATLNAVDFSVLPIVTSVATLHQESTGACALAGSTLDWVPNGPNGFLVVASANCANASTYGTGCVGQFASVYEHFLSTPSIDLSNSAMLLLYTGSSYLANSTAATFIAPSGTATNLNLMDDDETTITLGSALSYPGGSTTTLNVCSNGHVSVASNGAAFDYTPTPQELLDWPNTTWAVWHDFIPNATGNVWFEEVGSLSIVTWNGVIGYVGLNPGVTPSTFQIQFDRANGSVTFVFLSMDTVSISTWTGGEGYIVGYSPGGVSVDPGSTDLSAALPSGLLLAAADLAPLSLHASAPPLVNTTIQLVTANIPASAPFGAVLLGLVQFDPGISLAGLGMPGCFRYTDGPVTLLFFPLGNSSHSTPFVVPNMVGLTFRAQSAVYAPAAGLTPLGAISSNGLTLQMGN